MAKTKPIGVRFDEDILKEIGGTPQSVLISLEGLYRSHKSITNRFFEIDTPIFTKENVGFLIPTSNPAGEPVTITITEKDHYNGNKANRKSFDEVGQWQEPKIDNAEIEKQIAAIKAEKIPAERNTTLGKKIWASEQQKRILQLQKQLK